MTGQLFAGRSNANSVSDEHNVGISQLDVTTAGSAVQQGKTKPSRNDQNGGGQAECRLHGLGGITGG